MSRVLVLYAHPDPGRSTVNARLAAAARTLEGVTLVDLYAAYPRFKIDVEVEQARLAEHGAIVLLCPFHWYSVPALLKEWMDRTLEFGFAYGEGGDALAGKTLLAAISTGGAEEAYSREGHNRFRVRELLTPLEQTANLCRMRFLPPFVLFAALRAGEDGRLEAHVEAWRRLLAALVGDGLDADALAGAETLDPAALPPADAGAAA